jgi:hypothetical protein
MVVVMAAVTVGPVFTDVGGQGNSIGKGTGAGNAAHADSGTHTSIGGGQLNNPT